MMYRQNIWRKVASIVAGLALTATATVGSAQAWKPEKSIEIVVPSAPGGSNDRIARIIQKIMQEQKLLPVAVAVLNKSGGNQTLSRTYINQNPGDAHFLDIGNPTLISNHITGISPQHFSDFTPIALMVNEYTSLTVRTDSPLRNARDLVEQLKNAPEAISVGISNRGGTNHLALSLLAKAGGVDPKRLKVVVFKTNAEGLTAMLGGHIQMVASSVGTSVPQMRGGHARIISVSAPQRMSGDLAQIPTLREQGYDVSLSNWRSVVGPRGLTPEQIAYWEGALAKVVATDEWKAVLDKQFWDGNFLRSREFTKYLEIEYSQTKAVLTELGLVK
jgi:putative tricarboxylic transport membrane protein